MADNNEKAAVSASEPADAEGCFARGMIYSAGAGVAVDLIEAHQWVNIAALRGHGDGARLRPGIAEQMSDAGIGRARGRRLDLPRLGHELAGQCRLAIHRVGEMRRHRHRKGPTRAVDEGFVFGLSHAGFDQVAAAPQAAAERGGGRGGLRLGHGANSLSGRARSGHNGHNPA